MKKLNIFKSFGLVCSTAVLTAVPTAITLSSCGKDKVVATQAIELACRPNYVCPGESLTIHKLAYPAEAAKNKTEWKILDCPYEGFTISSTGVLKAPKNITVNAPKMMHVRAIDVENPKVFDDIAIGIVKEEDKSKDFIGFADNSISYTDVYGKKQSVKIVQDENNAKQYHIEKPIDLFHGRQMENIEFLPIVGRGKNSRMKFHLHGEYQYLRSLSWFGYSDRTWTNEIPSFRVTFVQYRHDIMEVWFGCDSEMKLTVNFNVWQQPEKVTNVCMQYTPKGETDYHKISEIDDGMFESKVNLYEQQEASSQITDVMSDIYIYRKPYEYLDDFRFEIDYNTELTPELTRDMFSVELTSERITLRDYDYYPAYKVELKFTFNPNLIFADKYDYSPIMLFTLRVFDSRNIERGTCTFHANWIQHVTGGDYEN